MLDDALRRRLEDLNRAPLVGRASPPDQNRGEARRTAGTFATQTEVSTQAALANAKPTSAAGQPGTADLLDAGKEIETPAGKHLRIVRPVEAIWANGERLVAARHAILSQSPPPSQRIDDYVSESRALVASFPDRTMFLDLETCGLAGAALFLVGLLRRIDGRLAVELLLARNYAEEKAVLVSLWERAAAHDVLVTFNGKSFDWPMVLDRSTRYLLRRAGPTRPGGWGRSEAEPPANRAGGLVAATSTPATRNDARTDLLHIDILHHARRRWRGRLPDCKLQTLERYVCGRRRHDDIPGAQIPAAYQRFVETGEPREMESILAHNALDLVTLLDLSMRLAT